MSRATEDSFDTLHELVTDTLIEQIRAYKLGQMKDGDGLVLPMPPALLAQAIKLLKDNGIDSPQRAQKIKDALAGRMPEFDPEDTNVVPMRSTSCQ